jgi:hypothetical protein
VGIVTIGAVPISHDPVDTLGFFGQQVVMAIEADLVRVGGQKTPVVGSVGIVALRTLSFGDRCVDMAKLHLFLKSLVAGQAKLPIRTGLELVGILGMGV